MKNKLLIGFFSTALFAAVVGCESFGIPITGRLPEIESAETAIDFLDLDNFEEMLDSYLTNFEIPIISFETFLENNQNADSAEPQGVYAEGLFAYQIIQQPNGSINFVPTADGLVSQFALAKEFGSTGLLGHNYLSGDKFFDISLGQELQLVFNSGRYERFRVIEVREFQALSPTSVYSSFRELSDGTYYSSTSLFELIYDRPNHLVFQVCITKNGNYNWGRYFVIAEPIID